MESYFQHTEIAPRIIQKCNDSERCEDQIIKRRQIVVFRRERGKLLP